MLAGSVGFFGSVDDFSATISPRNEGQEMPLPSVIATKAPKGQEPSIFISVRPLPGDKIPIGSGINVILHDASKTTSHLLYINKTELGWVRNSKKRWAYKVRGSQGKI
jgi:hypothetical protein